MIKVLTSIIAPFILIFSLLLSLILSTSASIKSQPEFTHEDISKLKKTLAKSNPFEFQRFKHQSIVFDEQLLNQSANFALNQVSKTFIAVKLSKNKADLIGTIKIASISMYVNFSCNLYPSDKLLRVNNIFLGSLPVPNWLTEMITPIAMRFIIERYPDYINLLNAIKKINISENKLTINYHWNTSLSKKIKTAGRNFFFDPEQQRLLGVYYQVLGDVSRSFIWRPIGLHQIIQPIFALASERSQQDSNPIEENKAALLALGIMASGIRANHLLQNKDSKPLRNAYFSRLTLHKRRDLMQHFLISAALAISTNKNLSDTIGLSKEMDDSKGGSGFSFADLLADRTGVELAHIATQNIASAKRIQAILSKATLSEQDFMPTHNNLPESISELEFKRKFIDVHHEKYLFVEEELQRRISSVALYNGNE